jgi:hypothetical protein
MYSVLVTGEHGCSTIDSVYVAYDVPDIGITRITDPVSSCELGQNNPVSVEIINNGFYRIKDETITIAFTVNNGPQTEETFNIGTALQPGSSRVLTFVAGYDFSIPGTYQLSVNLDYTPDENLLNNALSSTVSVWGFPDVEIGGGQDTVRTSLPVTLDAGPGYTSYRWQDNSGGSTFNVTQWGLYWVTVTNEHGCSDRDSVYVLSAVNVEDLQAFPGEIKIYPNPVKDILNVAVETDAPKHIIFELYSLQSALIYQEDFKETQLIDKEINVQRLTPGVYFLQITADQIQHTYKVVVVH